MSESVPAGWGQAHIGSFGKVVTGSTPSTKKGEYWDGSIPFISPADFDGSVFAKKTERYITEKGLSVSRELPENTILVTCIGSIGGIAMTSTRSISNQQINSIVCNDKNHPRFIYYLIQFNISELERLAGKTTLPIINKSTFELISLVLPPLPEQQKIASILTSVDTVIEKTEAQINKLKDLKKAMMQELLTKGIGHTEFKDSPVGKIPKGWEVIKLSDYSNQITKGGTPTTYGFDWVDSGILFLRSECVKEGKFSVSGSMCISQEAHDSMSRSKIHGGDILITITGYIGNACVFPTHLGEGNINQHIARVRIESPLLKRYIMYWLNSEQQRREYLLIQTGQAYPQLSLKQIQDTLIPCPQNQEMERIVFCLDSMDAKLNNMDSKLSQTKSLKKALMQDLLTGKVRVAV